MDSEFASCRADQVENKLDERERQRTESERTKVMLLWHTASDDTWARTKYEFDMVAARARKRYRRRL